MHSISTTIFQTATIPWDGHHMQLGKGYDVYHSDTIATPFEPVELPKAYPKDGIDVKTSQHVLRSESDRQRYTSARASASVSFLPFVAVDAVADIMKTAVCNETNLTVVTSCTVDCPTEDFEHRLRLNDTGSECLNARFGGATRFKQRYGEYCITGFVRQATFTAISRYQARDKAILDAYAASLSVGATYGQFGVVATTKMMDAAWSSDREISQTHDVHISGYNADDGLYKTLHDVNVPEMWADFLANMSPRPQLAIIRHYSTLFPDKIARPTAVIHLPVAIINALRKCTEARLIAQSNPLHSARRTAHDLGQLGNTLLEMRKHISNEPLQLNEVTRRLAMLSEEVELCQRRAGLLKLVEQAKKIDSDTKTKSWIKCTKNGSPERRGIIPYAVPEIQADDVLSADIQTSNIVFHPGHSGANPVCQTEKFPMILPGRLIIGAEIVSHWGDGTNGWWARREGGIGENHFGVRFSTEHYRGAHWSLTVWSVDDSELGPYNLNPE